MSIKWAARGLLNEPNHPRAEEALEAASFILWSLSGRQYTGVHTVREVYATNQSLASGAKPYPVTFNNKFYNVAPNCCCTGCGVFHRTRLRGSPVRRINKVFVDGHQLQPDEYVLLDHSVLGFLKPDMCCAQCITVDYIYGFMPPGGESAAAQLANELLASSSGEDCNLPQRVTSVTRQGVSFTLLDPQDFLKDRRTGIYEIDLLLSALNPAKSLAKPRVFSPDIPKAETWKQLPPPPSAVVDPGDQAVIQGYSSTWIVENQVLRDLVDTGHALPTQISWEIKERSWEPVDGSTNAVSLTLSAQESEGLLSGDSWSVLDLDGNRVMSGKIQLI